MIISVVIVEGSKQIMLTPETEHEKHSLSYINPTDSIEIVCKQGSFSDKYAHAEYQIQECQGGYLRAFNSQDSIMFVVKDKKEVIDEK